MARVSVEVAAPADDVWAVLEDGWTFANWVVGTVKIRDVDPGWPAAGSRLHHAVGAWPLTLQDETEVLECDPGTRLVMQARAWPFGEASVEIVLHSYGARTRVEMAEEPVSGPGAWLNNPVVDAVGAKRLDETLDRLRRLVEGHRRDGRSSRRTAAPADPS
jgi:uncharacterized protein YndB with AHSA1/START domain